MDRHWLITWTCYGTWLPGSADGFVGNVRDKDWNQVSHTIPGTPVDADMPRLEAYVRAHMTGEPVTLDKTDADVMIKQFQETAQIRKWTLQAASVMYNHTHLVVSVAGDPDPHRIRETFMSWATRALKKHRPIPSNGTFWTAKGSNRKLPNDEALLAGVIYVARKQPNPLAVYVADFWQTMLDEYDLSASRAP